MAVGLGTEKSRDRRGWELITVNEDSGLNQTSKNREEFIAT